MACGISSDGTSIPPIPVDTFLDILAAGSGPKASNLIHHHMGMDDAVVSKGMAHAIANARFMS